MIKWQQRTGTVTRDGVTFTFTIRPGQFFQRLRMTVVVSAGDRVLLPYDGGSIAMANDTRRLKLAANDYVKNSLPFWLEKIERKAAENEVR